MEKGITQEQLQAFSKAFESDPAHIVAMNATAQSGIGAAATNVYAQANYPHAFSVQVDAGEVTNQKKSGRCWMFASYNVMRLEVMKKLRLKSFELSQKFPQFYDKLERANTFLENMLSTLDEPLNGRVMQYLLRDPIGDGGQWDMFRSIVAKYGAVPKDVYPETAVSSDTHELNDYLTKKLREFACALRTAHEAGTPTADLRAKKTAMLQTIYRMLAIAFGEPPKRFTWETRNEDGEYVRVADITPQAFFAQYVDLPLDDLVTVINAPTADKPYGRTYTVQYLASVYDAKYPVKYLNLPMDALRRIAIAELKDGRVVWFGSDVGQFSARKSGILSLDALHVDKLFDTTFPMTKAQRLDYGESLMTHAMVLTGVELDDAGKPVRWRVENSWGDEVGQKGYFVMSDAWFGAFAYQILLDRKYLSEEEQAQFATEPVVLAPWDPMGSLAW